MVVKNKVQLITYPDSLGGNLKTLNTVLSRYFIDIFEGGIHILPPYPSSGDRGFAPVSYLDIDPKFGTWEDIRQIASNFDLILDLMVNHISRQSVYFKDYIKKGKNSEFADLFLTIDKIWPDGKIREEDIQKMFLRRAKPYSNFKFENIGKEIKVWTTFGKQEPSEQIDIDVNSELTKKILTQFLKNFKKQGIKIIRLDAIAYVIKKAGTSCFFVEPEIYQFIDWITEEAKALDLELLPEVHAPYTTQFKLAEKGYWIYDFILPYTILEAFISESSENLKNYLKIRPHRQFTMLDCHDGIPVKPDMNGLASSKEARKVVDICVQRGANLSLVYSDKYKSADGFDVHQIRGSYFSLLNSDEDAYIAARAIQFFTPGIPQVYYVGLLAGRNDNDNLKKTGEGREINRHNFTTEEINSALEKEVVKRLLKLIRFRNTYSAFDGKFNIADSNKNTIEILWVKDEHQAILKVDLKTRKTIIRYINNSGMLVDYEA